MSEVSPPEDTRIPVVRAASGGVLMGLANLVPGISGGTMLLASGVYPDFIRGVAEVSKLTFRKRSLGVLVTVAACAGLSILLLAGPVRDLVVGYRWVMYSLFIGLTLGGVPIVWKMAQPAERSTWTGAALGFVGMSAIALAQASSPGGVGEQDGFLMMLLAGIAAASAMILPGVSGSYLLLVLGVYVPILAGVDGLKEALKAGDIGAAMGPGLSVVLPVGIGVVLGVVVVSNLLEILLARYEKGTLGVLLGLLFGAVVGLWPFQRGVAPEVGEVFRGRVLTAELLAEVEPEKYPTEFFTPSVVEMAGALALVCLGFGITWGIARLGHRGDASPEA